MHGDWARLTEASIHGGSLALILWAPPKLGRGPFGQHFGIGMYPLAIWCAQRAEWASKKLGLDSWFVPPFWGRQKDSVTLRKTYRTPNESTKAWLYKICFS